ncbi:MULTISPECIES: OmpW family outer membrane protein [Marinobacter]|jgi:outer membrane protein W|uniref:OmpW family outer membrane protein n=1 Tax=Marinobacter TaxID=2742 RepID=UPI00241BEEC6|nr:OmpW family outer membrane protein [Marinobacter nauticus]
MPFSPDQNLCTPEAEVRGSNPLNWSANFDVRYAPFEADITGNLGPAPVQAKVEVDPTIVSIGVAYRF